MNQYSKTPFMNSFLSCWRCFHSLLKLLLIIYKFTSRLYFYPSLKPTQTHTSSALKCITEERRQDSHILTRTVSSMSRHCRPSSFIPCFSFRLLTTLLLKDRLLLLSLSISCISSVLIVSHTHCIDEICLSSSHYMLEYEYMN